jgi:F420H(2)-dependent quinone reductase
MVGSIGGNPKRPAWYHNLKANPDCEVDVAGGRRSMRARQASEPEAEQLWPRLLEMWPAWADYMKRTDRAFPVMILEPREA